MRAHREWRLPAATTMPPPIGFGSHVILHRPTPGCHYKAEILWEQKSFEYSFPDDISFPDDLPLYAPAHNLNEICKEIVISAYSYHQNIPCQDMHLILISEIYVTYIYVTSSRPTTNIL